MGLYRDLSRCPGKLAARAVIYAAVDVRRLLSGHHVCLASRECGDVRYLLALGCSPRHIHAIDTDPQAIENARQLGCQTHLGTIEEWSRTYLPSIGHRVASINLDLCGGFVTGIPTLLTVIHSLPLVWDGTLTLTFSRQGRGDVHLLPDNSTESRLTYLSRRLTLEGPWCKSPAELARDSYHYQSATVGSPGSPMTVVNLSIGDAMTAKKNSKTEAAKWRSAGLKAWETRRKNEAAKKRAVGSRSETVSSKTKSKTSKK